jgi:hypothetical protein
MASEAIARAVTDFFAAQWAAGGHTETVGYENVKVDPVTSAAYLELEVWDGLAVKASVGVSPQLRRSSGTVFVTVNTPQLQATSQPRQLCDSIATIFRDVQLATTSPTGTVTFQEPSVSRLGKVGVQFQMKVAVPFLHEYYI